MRTALPLSGLVAIWLIFPSWEASAIEASVTTSTPVSDARLKAADSNQSEWLSYGRSYTEQRFSPLQQITRANVGSLGLSWYQDLGSNRGQQATPLMIDGILYVSTAWSRVYAFEAKSGRLLWLYDPKVPPETAAQACCDVVNRGVAAWGRSIFVGTLDGRLISLDARNGRINWSVATFDPAQPYTITGAPKVVKGKVLIGNGGAEYGVRGFVTAYDAATGRRLWRFYTVPGDPARGFEQPALKMAARTWRGQWWRLGGGGTVWDAMAYDPSLDLLYIGVGNGSPWNQRERSAGQGDNLFLSSIVALRPDTGQYVWHYQTTPGESWDYTATQHIMLADLSIDGRVRRVLMQAPKNGFFYVLDRATGELLSAKNYVPVNWATGIDMKTGRPIQRDEARYRESPALVTPSPLGGHNWQPMSFNPSTGLVYFSAQELAAVFSNNAKGFQRSLQGWNLAIDPEIMFSLPSEEAQRKAIKPLLKGYLLAWDPVLQREAWRVDLPSFWNGGTLSTAGGLVFQGNSSGNFVAYDAKNGAKAWEFQCQTGIVAPPITYSIDGEQYVAVLAGWGGVGALGLPFAAPVDQSGRLPINGRLLVFKLNDHARLPPVTPSQRELPKLDGVVVDAQLQPAGRRIYARYCVACHGPEAVGNGVLPDLRYAGALVDSASWQSIVREGALASQGMVGFGRVVSESDAEAIRAFIIGEARRYILLNPANVH